MAKKSLVGLLKRGWDKFLDPEAETRIEEACQLVRAGLKKYRKQYDFSGFARKAELSNSVRKEVQRRVYSHYVKQVWKDLLLSAKEKATIEWIADSLELSTEELESIHSEIGCWVYAQQLAEAVSDGVVTEDERNVLQQTAEWMGISLRQLTHTYFADQGENFLRGVFLSAIEDNVLLKDEWEGFLNSAQNLGFTRKEALELVEPHARRFVSHVLADAKTDLKLSEFEEESLNWMLSNFELDNQFSEYVLDEMGQLRQFTQIANGMLPTVLEVIPVETRAGEIIHFAGPCVFQRVRHLKSGPKVDKHIGDLVITDNRIIFSSDTRPFTVNHRSVISIEYTTAIIDLKSSSTATGRFDLRSETLICGMILEAAIRKANQKLIEKTADKVDRHIPREVRQRVWQRYGGRCVECQSDQYLEFDHIIPVAKGGSNADKNIQLLCRRCNLKKSDHI